MTLRLIHSAPSPEPPPCAPVPFTVARYGSDVSGIQIGTGATATELWLDDAAAWRFARELARAVQTVCGGRVR
jgi:hypothetical protein